MSLAGRVKGKLSRSRREKNTGLRNKLIYSPFTPFLFPLRSNFLSPFPFPRRESGFPFSPPRLFEQHYKE